VVAAHTAHALAHALRAATGPVVAHRRVDFPPNRIGRRRLSRAANVIAVSAAVRAVLVAAGIPPGSVAVVYDGVDPAPDPAPASAPVPAPFVLAVGALVPHKGHATLVSALPLLPGVHAAIAGEGPLRSTLARQAARLGVSDRLHLLGQRTDVPSLLRSADVVCHPSHEEGLGQVVIEALLARAAVVASRVGGLPEIVEGRGVLVPPRDPRVLADALRLALADPSPLRRAASSAADLLRRAFSVERMVRETVAVYGTP
jgi:glycosyltransferase involved in cell wall biosynthesis